MSLLLAQERTTRRILRAFYDVYNRLGFGFLESVYGNALELELREHGLLVRREMPVRVHYRGHPVGEFRADIVVEDVVLVEIKASRLLDPHAREQTLNYLRGTELEIGLILHFGTRPQFERLISSYRDPRRSVGPSAAAGGIRADPRPSSSGAEEINERSRKPL